jgi:nucleoside-diphosphate-sugar epimerase
MRVLITGGNGFLGSGTARELLKREHDICILSRNNDKIQDLLGRVTFAKLTDDLTFLRKSVLDFSPDAVIDCAWSGGNSYKDINSMEQFYSNIPRGLYLLETLNMMVQKPSYMGFGTFAEYGNIFGQAVETEIETPQSFYGLSKMTMKSASNMYCKQNRIAWSWVRPCYTYGPRDVHTRLIPTAIRSLLSKKQLILNSCRSTVDYLYIDDFCNAICSILDAKKDGIFNICSGNEYALVDILAFLQKELKFDGIVYDPSLDRESTYRYTCGSNEKLKMKTHWKPTVDITQGLLNTIAYERELMEMTHNE